MSVTTTLSSRDIAEAIGLPPPTDEQAAVIEADSGAAVVIAGAGSGKTETMASRVLWLVANQRVAPDCVLGLTFTRKAAAELGQRIRRQLRAWARHVDPQQRAQLLVAEPTVLTYAAYCGRLVADHALRLGLEPSTRLISPATSWQIADEVVRRFTGELPEDIGTPSSVTRYVLALAAELSDHLQTPAAVLEFTDRALEFIESLPMGAGVRAAHPYPQPLPVLIRSLQHRQQLLPLVAAYREQKLQRRAVDFADQMVWAAQLAELPEVRAAERERYRAVLLDEYQDTGHAQIQLLRRLFDGGHPVTAVGDPFQSIYGWRGASAGNIGRFVEDFGTTVKPFPLSVSWRNDEAVLQAANAVAADLRAAHSGTVGLRARPTAEDGVVRAAYLLTVDDEAQWVANQLRRAWEMATPGQRTAAVLVRRRTQIPLLESALHDAGLPVEVVGLGGLLTTPEVIDVVATLQVLADDNAGAALLRLLTGARWRIGPRDLLALSRRANELANPDPDLALVPDAVSPPRVSGSIVEALDDLGPRQRYSPAGFTRMSELAAQLRYLRTRLSGPLPDLIAEVERVSGLDIEVRSSASRAHIGRVHLDRFADAASAFTIDSDEATLTAFLAFLAAAEDEENGLESGEVEVATERIQILTVHGAKGLEWDLVAVPGLVDKVFPAPVKNSDWTRSRQLLPFELRGDADDLPRLDLYRAADRRELAGFIKANAASAPGADFEDQVRQRHDVEERRLAYVAATRARHILLVSGYHWDNTQQPRVASAFLTDIAEHAERDIWEELDAQAVNPLAEREVTAPWPADPLAQRREYVLQAAELVRQAGASRGDSQQITADSPDSTNDDLSPEEAEIVAGWRRDVEVLLAERAARRARPVVEVEVPQRLSVSQLVSLRADPAELARRLVRPMPAKPAPLARRGTMFHSWLEQRWGADKLLDIDELPGAADESAAIDDDLVQLREAFLASDWAARTPIEIEVPFDMVIAGVVLRGRMDAVFADVAGRVDGTGRADITAGGDGKQRWTIVDWKTGVPPRGEHAQAAAVQLAAYRLAWARLMGIGDDELDRVSAAFHYVRDDATVRPADLLDLDGLTTLLRQPSG